MVPLQMGVSNFEARFPELMHVRVFRSIAFRLYEMLTYEDTRQVTAEKTMKCTRLLQFFIQARCPPSGSAVGLLQILGTLCYD